jgi:4-hydroxy 2-oxovalerate aldolase
MGVKKLLDCTLRDGGYINDWKFGHNNLVSIFERLADANVDIIEIGFLDDRRPFDIDRSIMPDTGCVEKIYGGLDRKQAMVVGMVDYGTCALAHIQPCEESFLDGIRVIFKKHLRNEALEYCAELKKKGYKVFAQLVSVTSYEDEEMMDLIRLANTVKPYAVSMVDTYGLMHQNNLRHYFDLLNNNLDLSIGIGYHAHNNFQMGYANCIAMLEQEVDRDILVDGTIYGMGKSAGNAPIELIAMHMNAHEGKNYHISQFLEAIDTNISNFYTTPTWGYNMFYYLSASNDCHPGYVSDLMEKRTLSVKSINEILGRLQGEKKVLYSKEYIEQLYKDYQDIEADDKHDMEVLKKEFEGQNVLILGPGKNIYSQLNKIKKNIEDQHPIVISINFVSKYVDTDYVFLSNSKRYVQLATVLSKKNQNFKVIATSNVTKTSGKFDYTLKYGALLDEKAEIIDNSLIMLLKVIQKFHVENVFLAGFDGYIGDGNQNYINPDMEYSFSKEQAERLNKYVSKVILAFSREMKISFITDSLYL